MYKKYRTSVAWNEKTKKYQFHLGKTYTIQRTQTTDSFDIRSILFTKNKYEPNKPISALEKKYQKIINTII